MILDEAVKRRIQTMLVLLNERQRRLYLAVEVQGLGYGGLKAVSEFTGVSESTIRIGQKELESGAVFDVDRVRKGGWGMFSGEKVEGLKVELENLMEKPVLDSGSGEFVLSWTTKSLLELEGVLEGKGVRVSHAMIGELLGELGYSLRQKRKMLHFGGVRPDRDAQFRYVNQRCGEFLARGWPVVSVVSEEKELLSDFRHITLRQCRDVVGGNVDFTFPVEQVAELAPLDVLEVNGFLGFVNLGVLPGMVDFGVEGLLRWWRVLGRHVYGDASKICVVSDGGGRGGVWYKLWRAQLQVLADVSGLEVCVLYLPPGTSRWHTVKHELFCFINESVDVGVPVSVRVAVKILSNKDWGGMAGVCAKDDRVFNLGLSVSDEDLSLLNLVEDEFNGHWNYTIRPKEA
jgi:transposase